MIKKREKTMNNDEKERTHNETLSKRVKKTNEN